MKTILLGLLSLVFLTRCNKDGTSGCLLLLNAVVRLILKRNVNHMLAVNGRSALDADVNNFFDVGGIKIIFADISEIKTFPSCRV